MAKNISDKTYLLLELQQYTYSMQSKVHPTNNIFMFCVIVCVHMHENKTKLSHTMLTVSNYKEIMI